MHFDMKKKIAISLNAEKCKLCSALSALNENRVSVWASL